MSRGPTFLRRTARALPLAPVFVLLMAGLAFGDIQATANAPPDSSSCSVTSPSAQCGQWTYWAAIGAMVIGVVLVAVFVIRYLKDAPRFQTDADGKATPGRAQAVAAAGRPLAPPPPVTAVTAPAPSAAPAAAAEAAPSAPASAVAVAEPPPTPEAGAAVAVATRPPSPRREPVEPDQATYDKTLAEQLAKGTDRRVAEGRAKAAALKAGREKAGA